MVKSRFYPLCGWMDEGENAVDCSLPGLYHAIVSHQASGEAEEDRWRNITARSFGGQRTRSSKPWKCASRSIQAYGMENLSWSVNEILSALTTAYDKQGTEVAECDDYTTDWSEI